MSGALPDAEDTGGMAAAEANHPAQPASDVRVRAIETVVLVASVIVLRLLGVALLVVSTFRLGSPDSLLTLVGELSGDSEVSPGAS